MRKLRLACYRKMYQKFKEKALFLELGTCGFVWRTKRKTSFFNKNNRKCPALILTHAEKVLLYLYIIYRFKKPDILTH